MGTFIEGGEGIGFRIRVRVKVIAEEI